MKRTTGATITLGDLVDVRAASLVAIRDSWAGLNPHAPIRAFYELRRAKRGPLAGTLRLSTQKVDEVAVPVAVSAAAATRFLGALAAAPVVPGEYRPTIEHTDDFPHIEIDLHVASEEAGETTTFVRLYTKSQGQFHAPWGARIGRKVYTLPGDRVGHALAEFEPPVRRRELERLMNEADDVMDLAESAVDGVTIGTRVGPAPPDGPGKELATLLNEMSFEPIRKPYGMHGRIDVHVREVTPDVLTVSASTSQADVDPEHLAHNLRNVMLALLGDMVPCPKFRAVCSNSAPGIARQEHVLDFCPLAQHPVELTSQVILIEPHAETHRAKYRARIEALWNRIVASAQN